MIENIRDTLTLAMIIALIVVVGVVATVALRLAPPGVGVVTEKGSHPAFFPEAFCNEERYYIVIEHPSGKQCWTWYIDEWYWKRWEVGDKVGYWKE